METEKFAYIVVSAVLREQPGKSIVAAGGLVSSLDRPHIEIFALEELEDPFKVVVAKAERLANGEGFELQRADGAVDLVVDNSEGTQAEIEQLWEMEEITTAAVAMTSERKKHRDGNLTFLPSRDVVGALQRSYQERRVQISTQLALAQETETALQSLTLRDAEEVAALPLAIALIVHRCNEMAPEGMSNDDDDDDPLKGYDSANWGLG